MYVIPIRQVDVQGRVASSYQYTVSNGFAKIDHSELGTQHPAVQFDYTLSSVAVSSRVRQKPLARFLAYCCAILGGVFTVMGLISRVIERVLGDPQRHLPISVGMHPTNLQGRINDECAGSIAIDAREPDGNRTRR